VRVVFSWSLGQNAELKKSQIQNPENENKIMNRDSSYYNQLNDKKNIAL